MSQSLWYDEISVTQNYLKNIYHLLDAWTFDSNMPVHYTLMFFWDKLFPDTEFSLHFPPLLFGMGSLFLAYQIAKEFFDRQIALLTLILLTVSPVHIWYSTEARPYAAMMFFLLLALLAFKRLSESDQSGSGRTGWLVTYFLAIFLGTFSHFYMIIPVLLLSGILLLQKTSIRFKILFLNAITCILLAGFLFLKYKFAGYFPTGANYLRPFTPLQAWLLFFNWFPTGNTIRPIIAAQFQWQDLFHEPVMLLYQLFVFFLLVKGIVAILKKPVSIQKIWDIMLLGMLFSIPLFLVALNIVGRKSTYIERSVYVALPFFFMILAAGAIRNSKQVTTIFLSAGIVILSFVSTFGLFKNSNDACTVGPCKQDWPSVAKFIREDVGNSREDTAVVHMIQARSLPYYDSAFEDHVRLERLLQHLPRILAMVEELLGEQSWIAQSLRSEIQSVKFELDAVRRGKIAVLSFPEIVKKETIPYKTIFILQSPRYVTRPQKMQTWFQRRRYGYQNKGFKKFHLLDLYKFERP
jgi:hypothetical protein